MDLSQCHWYWNTCLWLCWQLDSRLSEEYNNHASRLEVALDWHTDCGCQLYACRNCCWKGEEMGCEVVHELMAVDYYCAWSHNHHLEAIQLIKIKCCLCGHDSGVWCKRQSRCMSFSSNIMIGQYPYYVGKMKCRNNIEKHLDSFLDTHTIPSWLVLRKCCRWIYCVQNAVLPLSSELSYSPSQCCAVLNCSFIFGITWISKPIPYQHSAHYSDPFAPVQDTSTAIA